MNSYDRRASAIAREIKRVHGINLRQALQIAWKEDLTLRLAVALGLAEPWFDRGAPVATKIGR